jgi:DNA-directed RNA polymerase subunit RPC12/RpoP
MKSELPLAKYVEDVEKGVLGIRFKDKQKTYADHITTGFVKMWIWSDQFNAATECEYAIVECIMSASVMDEEDNRPEVRCPDCGSRWWTLFPDDEESIYFANCQDCNNVYYLGDTIEEIEKKYKIDEE